MSAMLTASPSAFDPAAVIDHPSGYLALSPRNLVFRVPGSSGFIAYRKHGIHWIATDEGILSQSTQGFVSRDGHGNLRNPSHLYRPYRVRE